jgi:hypothetical protein
LGFGMKEYDEKMMMRIRRIEKEEEKETRSPQ